MNLDLSTFPFLLYLNQNQIDFNSTNSGIVATPNLHPGRQESGFQGIFSIHD